MNKGAFSINSSWLVVVTSLILCLALLISFFGPLSAGSAQADEQGNKTNSEESPGVPGSVDWPKFRFNEKNIGTTTEVVAPPLEVAWSYTTGDDIYSSPVVSNGILYVGSDDNKVYALDATTGAFIWSYTTGNVVRSTPAVSNGIVYVGSYDHKVYALNAASGAFIWSYTTGGSVISSPVVSNGVVYVGSLDDKVYALNADTGAWIWEYTTGWAVHSSPAVSDGIVYVGSYDGYMYALNAATGAFIWKHKITNTSYVYSSPAVSNGVVYIGSYNFSVYALDAATGAEIWSASTGAAQIHSSPAVSDGVVYVGSWDYNIRALDADTGDFIWNYTTGYGIESSPAVSHGMVYISSLDNKVYAFSPVTLYTVTFDTVPAVPAGATTSTITFDSVSYSDGDTASKQAQTYSITANPDVNFAFTRWETEDGVSVDNADSATTTCNVSDDGTLRMVQTALDTDGDGMPDWWEDDNGLNKTSHDDADDDGDGDDLTNLEEYQHGTKPDVADTDGGGIDDGEEVDNGWDPLDPADDYMPDLVVLEKYEQWIDFGAKSYNIIYTIKNQGNEASGVCQTRIYIDAGSYDENYACPALGSDATYSDTVGPYTMSGDSDSILVYADIGTAVAERDEDNNYLQNEWGTIITGVTTQVRCDILPGVSLQLFDAGGVIPIGSPATSDGSGDYTLAASVSTTGNYMVVASLAGYRDESQTVNIAALGQEYEANFRGETGLVPNAPDVFYVLECVNHWLYPPGVECGLTVFKVLAAVNAWLYPV